MSALLKVGLGVLVVSLIGAGVNLWARETFPTQWGGPNIGGGALQILFYLGALMGVVIIVIDLVGRRRSKS